MTNASVDEEKRNAGEPYNTYNVCMKKKLPRAMKITTQQPVE